MGASDDPHAVYIQDIAMAFAARHAQAVIQDERFTYMDDAIKGQMLTKLAAMSLLLT